MQTMYDTIHVGLYILIYLHMFWGRETTYSIWFWKQEKQTIVGERANV